MSAEYYSSWYFDLIMTSILMEKFLFYPLNPVQFRILFSKVVYIFMHIYYVFTYYVIDIFQKHWSVLYEEKYTYFSILF